MQCQDAEFEACVSNITAVPRRRARGPRLNIIALPKCRARRLHFNTTAAPKRGARGLCPASSSPRFSCKRALRLNYNYLHYWSSVAHVMRGVNPHYGGFLGDSFTPRTLYKQLELLLKRGQIFQLRKISFTKSSTLLHKLDEFKFCLNPFEISFDRRRATPSVIQGEKF